ncbi:MAG TPA: quinone oxidoreductase [Kiloniellales bacterium]
MKAIRIHRAGGPEVMTLEDVDIAPPGPEEVRVRHTAIGVNFLDTYHRSGLYKLPLPTGIGSEAAGVVEAVGAKVSHVKPGDRVAYVNVIGSYSEAANIPSWRAVKLPAGISDETAAAAMLKGMTAQYLLKRTFQVKPGQTILVHAAAGGVGLILCQWARYIGAAVIGTVGDDGKIELARANGCTHVLNSRKGDIAARVRALTGGVGVAVVYDSVGKDTFMTSLDCLQIRGLMVSFGNASGPVPPFEPHILSPKGSLYLTRPTLLHYTRNAEELAEASGDLFSVIASGAVRIAVNQRFPLSEARAAHEALHSRATTGATILIP